MAAMEDPRQQQMEEFLRDQDRLRKNAFKIILQMLEWSKHPSGSYWRLVDEILHSIFFVGKITKVKYEPENIITDEEMLNRLKQRYPGPLQLYKSQLPKRSPFSCVLDMIVLLEGQSEIERIKDRLQKFTLQEFTSSLEELTSSLEPHYLFSTTMCVTTCKASKDNYYGVSMSVEGREARKILIAASCLSFWEEYVAGAVMTFYPENANQKKKKKKHTDFDGTIQLPLQMVTCRASNIMMKTHTDPCIRCRQLFGLEKGEDTKDARWPHGNCAEAESVSKLLKKEATVREAVTSPTNTAENRKKAENSVRKVLKQLLKDAKFTWVGDKFYQPHSNTV